MSWEGKTLSDELVIEQKQGLGNTGTQIGVQTNIDNHPTIYVGPTLEDVTRIVTNLFLDNFTRMRQMAKEESEMRANELWDKIMFELSKLKINDLSAFTQVDVQYSMYEAQKNYARFATPELLSNLSSLIAKRVNYNDDGMCLKVAIDQAISIVGMLTQAQLDYLALMFLVTKVKFENINTIEDLGKHLNYLDSVFSKAKDSNWQHLNMLGCLQLDLPDVCKIYAKRYNFKKSDVEKICPQNIKVLSGDYSTSPIGTIIAIIRAEQKTPYQLDPKIWIRD